jgi:hypothetical protein
MGSLKFYYTVSVRTYVQCFGSGAGLDPDPGGQKCHVLKCWMFSLWVKTAPVVASFDKKISSFLNCKIFPYLGHQNLGYRFR